MSCRSTMNDNIDSASEEKGKKTLYHVSDELAVDPPLTCHNDKSPNVRLDIIRSPYILRSSSFVSGYERNTSLFHMEMYDVASKNRMIKLYFSLLLFFPTLLIFSVFLSSGNFSSSSSVRFLWLGMPGFFFG